MSPIFDRNFDQELIQGGTLAAATLATDDMALEELKQRLKQEAYAEGHLAGQDAARQEAASDLANRQQGALDSLASSVAELRESAGAHRQAVEQHLLEFVLNTCELVFPQIVEATSKDRAVAAIQRCIALAGGVSTLRITVSDAVLRDHGPAISAAFGATGDDMRISVQADPTLEDGDARVAWQHGSMDFSLTRITDGILNALRHAMADQTPQTPSTRSVTHD